MRKYSYLVILMALSVILVSCSKEAKDEAAQLERELSGDSIRVLDSLAVIQRTVDSIATVEADKAQAIALQQAEEAEAAKMPTKPAGEGYTVQVAGCENRDYANHLVKVYTDRGYAPFVTSITVEDQGYYRVRIGIFANLSDAKALQRELNDRYSIDTWVDVTVNSY